MIVVWEDTEIIFKWVQMTGNLRTGEEKQKMPRQRTHYPEYTFVVKEWLAIGIAIISFVFSAGGWYFKMSQYEKEILEVKTNLEENYVRKDVLGATLQDIQRQLTDQSTVMQNMNIKLDAMTVAVSSTTRVTR